MISSINNSAILGLKRSQQALQKVTEEIASFPLKRSKSDLNRSLVSLHENEHLAKANAEIFKTADNAIGFLLDELA